MSDLDASSSSAADPLLDAGRLEEIAAMRLLDADVAPALQDLVDQAAEQLGLPISLVSIVLDDAQHFAAAHGISGWLDAVGGTPVEWSFCAHAVRGRAPFIVEDATLHPRVMDNPLVRIDGVRCYAGMPLVSSRGYVLGTLCVIGAEPRAFDAADMDVLERLADDVVARLEARR